MSFLPAKLKTKICWHKKIKITNIISVHFESFQLQFLPTARQGDKILLLVVVFRYRRLAVFMLFE